MNEAIRNMTERRSVRKFQQKQIPEEDLQQILEAARFAPTGMDRQQVLYIVVQDAETLALLNKMNGEIMGNADAHPYYGAPTIVLVLVKADVFTKVEDGSLAMGNLMNAAYSLGIGSCWIHRAKEMFESTQGKELLKKWGVEGAYTGIGSCALGYSDGPLKEASPRKEQIIYVR